MMYYLVLKQFWLVGVFVALFPPFVSADPCKRVNEYTEWILIYENDKLGNTVCGKIQNLIEFVNRGRTFKAITVSDGKTYKVIHCKWVFVSEGHKSVLCVDTSSATNIDINRDYLPTREDLYDYWVLVLTDGMSYESRWPIGHNVSSEDFKDASSVKWFAKK